MQWFKRVNRLIDLHAKVDVNCEWKKDGLTDRRTNGRKTGRIYRTLLKQVQQKGIVFKRAA